MAFTALKHVAALLVLISEQLRYEKYFTRTALKRVTVLTRYWFHTKQCSNKENYLTFTALKRVAAFVAALISYWLQPNYAPPKKANWKEQHEEFISTIQAARGFQTALQSGKPLPPPPAPSANPGGWWVSHTPFGLSLCACRFSHKYQNTTNFASNIKLHKLFCLSNFGNIVKKNTFNIQLPLQRCKHLVHEKCEITCSYQRTGGLTYLLLSISTGTALPLATFTLYLTGYLCNAPHLSLSRTKII